MLLPAALVLAEVYDSQFLVTITFWLLSVLCTCLQLLQVRIILKVLLWICWNKFYNFCRLTNSVIALLKVFSLTAKYARFNSCLNCLCQSCSHLCSTEMYYSTSVIYFKALFIARPVSLSSNFLLSALVANKRIYIYIYITDIYITSFSSIQSR